VWHNLVIDNPCEQFITDILASFRTDKKSWYQKLLRKINMAHKIERYENLYEFLAKELINGMTVAGKTATSAQKWVRNYIIEKQQIGLLLNIGTNNLTNKPGSSDLEDDLTYTRNLFAHNPNDFSQAYRIDDLIMDKLLSVILYAINDK